MNDFHTDWGIDFTPEKGDDDDTLTGIIDGVVLSAALMPAPVPDGEAERYAENNGGWPEAAHAARIHKAHILVIVHGPTDAIEAGKLFTKAVASWLNQPEALAVYTNEYVFRPSDYKEVASWMRRPDGLLPILNWVWFGLYRTDTLQGVYTCGLRQFGKEEFEIYSDAAPDEIRDFLLDVVAYVLSDDVSLRSGETIGFSESQRMAITLSEGVALDGMTLKIDYHA